MKTLSKLLLTSAVALSGQSFAEEPKWGVGVAIASIQAPQVDVPREDFIAPFITYQSENLSIDFGSVRYKLHKSENLELTVLGQLRFDGYDPDESEFLSGMEERDPAFDGGISLTYQFEHGVVELKGLHDVTDTYDGYEIQLSYQYPYQSDKWLLIPEIGITSQSANLVDYYYGVRSEESTTGRSAYSGTSATNHFAQFSFAYQISNEWRFIGGINYTHLDSSISDSPIVAKDYQIAAFTAVVYEF